MLISPEFARNTVHDLVKFKSPDSSRITRNLGEIYLNCICCNTKRFNSIRETKGGDSIFWCKPCNLRARALISKINENDEDEEWKLVGELFNKTLYSRNPPSL